MTREVRVRIPHHFLGFVADIKDRTTKKHKYVAYVHAYIRSNEPELQFVRIEKEYAICVMKEGEKK